MKTSKRLLAIALASVAAFTVSVTASAASISVFLDESNARSVFPDGTNYLEVTIADGANGAIDFTVETTAALNGLADSNFGIQRFSLNTGENVVSADNLALPDGWKVKNGNGSHSVFGKFNLQLTGTGSSRIDPLQFSIVGIDGDTPEDYLQVLYEGALIGSGFAAHVAGFSLANNKSVTSAHFGGGTPVVPLPPAAWFMLSGLGVLAFRAKLRKRSDDAADEGISHAMAH